MIFGITSCSKEETKTKQQETSRPTVPVLASEVQIGTQVWMTKNLNVSRYRNGDPIPQITDPIVWLTSTTGAWCYYENNTSYGKIYGKLYNWYAVNDPRGLAPVGWHVPIEAEWSGLVNYLGGASVAGGKMKSITDWVSPNSGATNSSGFTGLSSGRRSFNGVFNNKGYNGYWWSSSDYFPFDTWHCYLVYDFPVANVSSASKNYGLSVRCIKD